MRSLMMAVVLGLGLGLTACPGPTFVVQQYPGPVRPQETVAILRVNGNDSVRLMALDDEYIGAPIETDSRLHIELLPGRHSLNVANASAPTERLEPIVFEAEANKVYRVVIASGASPHLFEVDRSSDAAGRDVTTPPAPPAPPPPPPSLAAPPPSETP